MTTFEIILHPLSLIPVVAAVIDFFFGTGFVIGCILTVGIGFLCHFSMEILDELTGAPTSIPYEPRAHLPWTTAGDFYFYVLYPLIVYAPGILLFGALIGFFTGWGVLTSIAYVTILAYVIYSPIAVVWHLRWRLELKASAG